jgi:hypothetical protein
MIDEKEVKRKTGIKSSGGAVRFQKEVFISGQFIGCMNFIVQGGEAWR